MSLDTLLEANRQWAAAIKRDNPDFFSQLAKGQSPKYLWIGCADSRVPANQILGLDPGEVFVHRNIANVVVQSDMNCLSVLQYAVDVLQVEEIIVCGHYGCGGVHAAVTDAKAGLVENWLGHIKAVFRKSKEELASCKSEEELCDKMVELNVREQLFNVVHTTVVQDAWARGQKLSVHGLVYSLEDGILKDLDLSVGEA